MQDLKLTNAYISIEVDDSALDRVYREISQTLETIGISYEKSHRPHVSIAYTVGERTIRQLEQVVDEIAEAPFVIEAKGICIIPGSTIDKNFIALQIQDNDDFLYAQEFVAENCEIKTVFDGKHFVAHVSLFMIDKSYSAVSEDLAHVLEIYANSLGGLKIKGKSISVFNAERQLIIKKNL